MGKLARPVLSVSISIAEALAVCLIDRLISSLIVHQGRVHWTYPFLQRLTHDVKLVGSTISCEGTPLGGMVKEKWRRNPHVQSYAVATDKVGLLDLRF